jgi:ATP-binding cassette subfamily B protein
VLKNSLALVAASSSPIDPGSLPISLGGQFRRHLPAYIAGTLVLAVFQFSLNRIDWLSKAAIDDVFGGAPEKVTEPAMWIFALALLSFVCRVASRWFIFNAGRDAEYELRALLLHRLHRLGTAFYRKMSAGEIMSRSTGDLQQVRLLLGFGILNIVNVVFAFASALQVMVNVSVKLTMVSFVMLPFLIFVTRYFSKQMFLKVRGNQESLGKLSEVLQTNLAGVRVVRSFALEKRERRRFDTANLAYAEASLALARLRGLMMPLVGVAASLGVLAFFWYGATLLQRGVEAGGITRGAFFAFWLAYGRMMWPMIALGFSIAIIQRGRAGYDRLKEIFDAEPEVTDGPLPAPTETKGALSVKGLSFAYGDHQVVGDVSFEVPAGKSIALVGRTGSGKSTIADLVVAALTRQGLPLAYLDGDVSRDIFPSTGFTRPERDAHIKRVGFLASRLEAHGVIVVASLVSPYESSRQFVRGLCRNYTEVYVATPFEECERRDVKGLYAKARRGEIKNFTGLDDPYEPPSNPELKIDTRHTSLEDAVRMVMELLKKKVTS